MDIVERLRDDGLLPADMEFLIEEAADEIERLNKNEQATLKTIETIQAIRMADEAEIERLRKLNKLIRPDDQYADYNFGATKVRHECVDREKQGDFEACHRDRRDLILDVERLRAALERIRGMSERPVCTCGIQTGTAAIKSCANTALKQSENEILT